MVLNPVALANAVSQAVEILRLILWCRAERVAGGIVEHHDVVELHLSQALCAFVGPLRPLNVRATLEHRQRVLREGQREWCLRLAWSVAHLRHEEIDACEQRFLQRRRWYDIVLEEKQVNEIDRHEGEHQSVDPRHDETGHAFRVAPPLPFNFLCDVDVEDKRHHHESQPALQPQQEEEVDRQDHYKLSPLLSWVKTCFFFVNHKIIFHTIRTLCSSPADD